MNYIIDTHVFLWLIYTPQKISLETLNILKNPDNTLYVTSVSFWEISLKYALGKLTMEGLKPDELASVAQEMGIEILNIPSQTMASVHNLAAIEKHKDPFDRLIIWHCIQNNHILISYDQKIQDYTVLGLRYLQ